MMACYDITLPADVPETQRIPSAGSSLRIWKQVIHCILFMHLLQDKLYKHDTFHSACSHLNY